MLNDIEIVKGFFDNRENSDIADKLGMLADVIADIGGIQVTITMQEGTFIGVVDNGILSFEKVDMEASIKRQNDEIDKYADLLKRVEQLERNEGNPQGKED